MLFEYTLLLPGAYILHACGVHWSRAIFFTRATTDRIASCPIWLNRTNIRQQQYATCRAPPSRNQGSHIGRFAHRQDVIGNAVRRGVLPRQFAVRHPGRHLREQVHTIEHRRHDEDPNLGYRRSRIVPRHVA